MRLQGKIGIVTAAGSGMGRAGALRFAREGAQVAVVDVAADRVKSVVSEITAAGGTDHGVVAGADGVRAGVSEIRGAGGPARGIVADLPRDDESRRIVWEARDRFKGL